MVSVLRILAAVVLFTAVAAPVRSVEGRGVLFSTLRRTMIVAAQIQGQNVSSGAAKVGDDHLAVQWRLDTSFPQGIDVEYASVRVELCFAPVSQMDRGWRKTKDDLNKDKTCPKEIATERYTNAGSSLVWRIPKDVPGAVYFVRVYVLSVEGSELAYGQSTDDAKTTNLITVIPITGKHPAMDAAGVIFSLLSVLSLFGFLAAETRSAEKWRVKS